MKKKSSIFKQNRMSVTDDSPNYPDHDFPYRNSKLTPYGYELLLSKPRKSRSISPPRRQKKPTRSRSLSPVKSSGFFVDKLGRSHTTVPRSGKLDLFIAANRHFNSTSTVHCRHLMKDLLPKWKSDEGILPEPLHKNVLIGVTDNGPDWNSDYSVNLLNFGRFWKESRLDFLLFVTFAPGDSRFNMIERIWAAINSCCAGVTLPITLPGENIPPCKQRISKAELEQKTDQVLWNANTIACKYLTGKKYDGFPITPHAENFIGKEEADRHDEIKSMLMSINKSKLKEANYKQLQEEYVFLIKHCVKRKHYIQFSKCESCEYCMENPVKATQFMKTIRSIGGRLPTPVESSIHKAHYKTLNEVLFESKITKDTEPTLDHTLPSMKRDTLKLCEYGCKYVMTSYADAKRHYLLMDHPSIPNMAKRNMNRKEKQTLTF